jgi:hypothetical protein
MVRWFFRETAKETAPFSREQYAMISLLGSSPTIDDGLRYTMYGALNAVTEYQNWNTRYNNGGASTEDKRTLDAVFGRAKDDADKTFAYLA